MFVKFFVKYNKGFVDKSYFSELHPTLVIGYLMSIVTLTVVSFNIVVVSISFFIGSLYLLLLKGRDSFQKNLKFSIIIVFLVTFINTMFTHQGQSTLFFINDNPITLESIVYGVFMGVMIATSCLWFRIFNIIVNGEMIMYVVGKISSMLALMVSMILRYVPLIKKRYYEINQMDELIYGRQRSLVNKFRRSIKNISILTAWSLETSIESASSMEARGYGLKGRKYFHLFTLENRDKIIILMIFFPMFITEIIILSIFDISNKIYPNVYSFFESVKGVAIIDIVFYIVFMVFCAIPLTVDLLEEIRWRRLEQKI